MKGATGIRRVPLLVLTASLLIAVAAGCGGAPPWRGGERVVPALQAGVISRGHVHRDEYFNIGLPPLHNLTGHPVRLLWVRWVNQPPAVHIVSVYAYTYAAVGYGIVGAEGDLPVACPHQFRPAPVTAAITPPHADSAWLVLITFKIPELGVYHLDRVKIGYVTDGRRGWQYQNLDTTFTVVNPPLPGPVPIPRSAICARAR